MSERVLMALSTFGETGDEPRRLLEASGHEVVYNPYGRRLLREEIVALGSGCTAVIAGVEPYDREVLDGMPLLRCISRCGVGIDNVDLAGAAQRGIAVLNTPGAVVQPVAELALAMAYDLLRRLSEQTRRLRAHRWEKLTGRLLAGKRVAVIGLGRIGRRTAELFAAVGATVVGVDPMPDAEWVACVGLSVVPLDVALSDSDIVVLHLSVPKDARFVLGEAEIASMRPGALLLNLARGAYVDEAALLGALSSGHLGGVGLDVYPAEPYDGPLMDFDNVVLTPHSATLTEESRLRMETECVTNLLGYFDRQES